MDDRLFRLNTRFGERSQPPLDVVEGCSAAVRRKASMTRRAWREMLVITERFEPKGLGAGRDSTAIRRPGLV